MMASNIVDWSQNHLVVGSLAVVWDTTVSSPTSPDHHQVGFTSSIAPLAATTMSTSLTGGAGGLTSAVIGLLNQHNLLVEDLRNTKEALAYVCHQLHQTGVVPGDT